MDDGLIHPCLSTLGVETSISKSDRKIFGGQNWVTWLEATLHLQKVYCGIELLHNIGLLSPWKTYPLGHRIVFFPLFCLSATVSLLQKPKCPGFIPSFLAFPVPWISAFQYRNGKPSNVPQFWMNSSIFPLSFARTPRSCGSQIRQTEKTSTKKDS